MKRIGAALFLATVVSATALAQASRPLIIVPESLNWFSPPNNSMVRGAWMLGRENENGPYVFRVVLARDGRLAVHTHPDSRHTTVLSGTLQVGFGPEFDESTMFPVPAGAIYVAPANTPHYLWARDGEVSYQESGFGPTETVPLKR